MNKRVFSGLLVLLALLYGSIVFGSVSQTPLVLTTPAKANVLIILDNSNSMDEDVSGVAVGSGAATSKSEIAREVIRNLITTYTGQLNVGLMAFQQSNVSAKELYNSQCDVSFDLGDGSMQSNVSLPMYADSGLGSMFCFSETAEFDNGSEAADTGPWDLYRCFENTTNTSNDLPTWDASNETATVAGVAVYTDFVGEYTFPPTDSSYAQDILDYGRFLSLTPVGPTWFSNSSSSRGYLHTPIAPLDGIQAGLLNTKLGISQFATNAPTDSAQPLQNAGLTPVEGTLLTARDYFADNGWSDSDEGYPAGDYDLPESCGHDYVILVTDVSGGSSSSGVEALTVADVDTRVVVVGTDPVFVTTSLQEALSSILDTIHDETSTAAAVAANSTRLNTTDSGAVTYLYQAKFNSSDWSGSLTAYPLATDGSTLPAAWSTDPSIDPNSTIVIPSHLNRDIYTWNGSAGLEFTSSNFNNLNFSDSQQTDLVNTDNLNWLRGDQSLEAGGTFRSRTRLLGDIINSTPAYISVLDFSYESLPLEAEASSYVAHVETTRVRPPMLYFGANDGMLHALNIDDPSSVVEEFAFIPMAVYPNLVELTTPGYSHKYYVDGSPVVGDAYISDVWNSSSAAEWRTVLIGTTAAGGQSVFALDVTDPLSFDSGDVMWEFTDPDHPDDLGYTFGEPVIARMANGKWAAIFGNGYNSVNGLAYLYIVDIETGTIIEKIATNADPANGLSSPAVLVNDERVVTTVYAGDLQGNLWKFDLSHSNTTQWGVDDNDGGTDPLFTARYDSNQIQPITSPLEISAHPNGGYMIFFGTGKYFEDNDNAIAASPDIQSFYGIWDDSDSRIVVLDRSTLVEQEITLEIDNTVDGVTTTWRITTQKATTDFNWTASSAIDKTRGWFMDLDSPGDAVGEGERVVNVPILRHGRVIFTTLIPSQIACDPGGSSWLMELEALTGNRLAYTALDVNGDGNVDTNDTITVLSIDGEDVAVVPSGMKVAAIMTTPKVIASSDKEYKYSATSAGTMTIITEKGGDSMGLGRRSWRQLH